MRSSSSSSFKYLSKLWTAAANYRVSQGAVSVLPVLHAATSCASFGSSTTSSLQDANWNESCRCTIAPLPIIKSIAENELSVNQQLSHAQQRSFASGPKRGGRVKAALQRRSRGSHVLQQANHTPQASPGLSNAEGEPSIVAADTAASQAEVANMVGHPALIVAREIEWGTVILGFEQSNKYTVLDENGATVALLAEDVGGVGTAVGRQLLRRRRPFKATVFTPDGSRIIFQIERPFHFINSSMFIKNGDGDVVGEVHQRWHLWRRKYALYIDRAQFAAIDGGLLAWEFVMRDADGGVLALIDRNFQGFGKELFTDAGKYVVHFGNKPQEAAKQVANTIQAAHPDKPRPPVTAVAKARNDLTVIPTAAGDQLDVVRPLGISERSAVLAAAISIDFDYFSQHSSGSAGGMFPWMIPMGPSPPYPEGPSAEDAAAGGGGVSDGNNSDVSHGADRAGGYEAAEGGAGGATAGGPADEGFGDGSSNSSGVWGSGGGFDNSNDDVDGEVGSGSGETDIGGDGWGVGEEFGGDVTSDSAEGSSVLSDIFSGWDS